MRSITINIFIAGGHGKACKLCAEWFESRGGCVTVTPTQYVYTGGREDGVIVGIINYPPYHTSLPVLWDKAKELAEFLRVGLGQQSYTIQGPDRTETVGR